MTDNPRNIALNLLTKLSMGHPHHLDRIISDDVDNSEIKISKRDRNLINALVYGVLRWREKLDWIIRYNSKTPIEKIQPEILNILRLGLFQIYFLDRIPESAAVNTSVELAKKVAPPWVVKFTNAVLRNAIRSRASLPYPASDNPVAALCISKSFPRWLIRKWIKRFGTDGTESLCDALNTVPPLTIRTNTIKSNRNELLEILAPETEKIYPTPFSPDGIAFYGPKSPIQTLPAFKTGKFQVQDEAAQLISYILSPQPDEKILDACAGLGGKTAHIAQLMHNTGSITALDKDKTKLSQLNAEMKRLGIKIVQTIDHDLEKPFPDGKLNIYDKILLDAPCSGLGVIRRNPDIKWDSSRKQLNRFQHKQFNLLNRVCMMVKPLGFLVYAVCSIEPEENETVITDFLEKNPHFQIYQNINRNPVDFQPFIDSQGFIRTLPHIHGMDGFFSVCLQRKA